MSEREVVCGGQGGARITSYPVQCVIGFDQIRHPTHLLSANAVLRRTAKQMAPFSSSGRIIQV